MEFVRRVLLRNTNYVRKTGILIRNSMTSASQMQKVTEELEKNPYFDKYAEKIAKLQQTSPEDFLARVEVHEIKKSKTLEKKGRQFTSLLQPKKELPSSIEVQDEPLEKIMKIELIKDKEADEVKQIWEEYHLHKDVIAATIPAKEFDIICEQSKKFPIFLFPLPQSQGYEFIMSEFRANSVHFTPLICYQVHKENAPECLAIHHYTEFKESKGIVLMRGEFDKNVMDVKQAQCLANQLQLYYNKRDDSKTKLLEQFTCEPNEFKHNDLIKQIETLTL